VTGLQVAATLLLNAYFHLSLQRMRVHYSLAFPFLRTWEPQIISQLGVHVHDHSRRVDGLPSTRPASPRTIEDSTVCWTRGRQSRPPYPWCKQQHKMK